MTPALSLVILRGWQLNRNQWRHLMSQPSPQSGVGSVHRPKPIGATDGVKLPPSKPAPKPKPKPAPKKRGK